MNSKFELPKYPYDQLNKLKAEAIKKFSSVVDLSIGTPIDSSPQAVKLAYANLEGTEIGYPPSIGTQKLLKATSEWLENLTGVQLSVDQIGSCIGTKEFIALLPSFLKLKYPQKDTVIGPALAYQTYEMG
jgi:aspartate/methionine/tyrosine aminotransferase